LKQLFVIEVEYYFAWLDSSSTIGRCSYWSMRLSRRVWSILQQTVCDLLCERL